ncbi:hypothetical protein, partial [Myceligenerans salitolerans]
PARPTTNSVDAPVKLNPPTSAGNDAVNVADPVAGDVGRTTTLYVPDTGTGSTLNTSDELDEKAESTRSPSGPNTSTYRVPTDTPDDARVSSS